MGKILTNMRPQVKFGQLLSVFQVVKNNFFNKRYIWSLKESGYKFDSDTSYTEYHKETIDVGQILET